MRYGRVWFMLVGSFLPILLSGQHIGIGTTTPDPSAVLDIQSTSRGLLVPRMTASQRTEIISPAEGLLVFDTDSLEFFTWRSGAWTPLAGPGDSAWQQDSIHVYRTDGNVGIGQPSPTGKLHVSVPHIDLDSLIFTGSGLNDLSVDPAGYNTTGSKSYAIRIQNAGPDPNLIEISDDGGMTWSGPVPINNPIDMGWGVTASFAATGGHTYGDRWDWTVSLNHDDILVVADQFVGIGTAMPAGRLHVAGGDLVLDEGVRIRMMDDHGNFFIGDSSGLSVIPGIPLPIHGSYNMGIGHAALYSNTEGYQNMAIGEKALYANTTGGSNLAVGLHALKDNTIGYRNTAVGLSALRANSNGIDNVALGTHALHQNTLGDNNTAIGAFALEMANGTNNTAVGSKAMSSNTGGDHNTALGHLALGGNTTGNWNTAVGYRALLSSTTATGNTAVGSDALHSNTSGASNTAFGLNAMYYNTTGSFNTAIGRQAMHQNNGNNNTALGYEALRYNSSGSANAAMGRNALFSNTTANNNTASGYQAMYSNTSGPDNTASGYRSLYLNTTGGYNAAYGMWALYNNTSGHRNAAVGYQALYSTVSAEYNTSVGYNAGDSYNNGWNNVFIGANVDVNTSGRFNVVAIGQGTIVDDNSKIYLGNGATGAIGGNVGWSNWSDGRFKRDVREEVPGLAFITRLRPVTYHMKVVELNDHLYGSRENWKVIFNDQMEAEFARRSAESRTGFIAQEVEAAAQAVGYNFDGVVRPAEEGGVYGLQYASFVVPLVRAVQEQQVVIETMQADNAALKAEVAALHIRLSALLDRLEAGASEARAQKP